ncbi:terminase large subunit, partial [Salmonella enterica]
MTAWNDYANDVKTGKIAACKRVKQAVNRYFSDLESPLYVFDLEAVEKFLAFSRVCPHVKGPLRGDRIVLEPWQQFAFANIIGMKVKATGRRKYSSAFIGVPRKNAKSTKAAILANWFLIMEPGQQDIYTAAVSRDQARIVFDDARQMCLLSKPLKKRVNIQQHKIIAPKTNSLLKPLAARAATIEGTNPGLAIIDEYHLHQDNSVYSALDLGMGARPEALLFAITTAGSNIISACKQHYDYCCRILDGEEENDALFVLIYELDDESEIDDPALWI